MIRQLRTMAALGATLALTALALAACGDSSPGRPAGSTDSGFRPAANGFAFENYADVLSNGVAPTNLTAHDVQLMFGDGVCADAQLRRCDLIPEAQAWLDSTNAAMAGGHCYGFSVLSELLWQHKLDVATLGAPATTGLAITDNQALQRLIAYDWALQTLPSVQSRRITGTPNQILAALGRALKPNPPETYTIAIWKRDGTGGHAVTPYAVQDKGGGKFDVLIYDNNWPGQPRAISFDTKADTWTYHAAINPSIPDSTYIGDAQTKTISLFPTSPGLGTQPCPFCAKVPGTPSAEAGNTEEIYLRASDNSDANLIITDRAGHRLGYINGKLVNEIPGAQVDPVISSSDWTNKMAPDFVVPADATYTITIDATALAHANTETVGIIGPSYDLAVKDIPMQPGDKDILVAEPDATRLSYTSSRSEAPTLELGVSDFHADFAFEIGGVTDQPGSTVNLSLPAEGDTLTLNNVGAARQSSVNFKMTRSTEQGVQVFSHQAIPLAVGATAQFRFGNWANTNQGIPLTTTHNGQSTSQTLDNQKTG